MKTISTVVKTILSVTAVCALGVYSDSSMAQTANSVSAGQTPKAVPARITQAIDEAQLFTAKGSVHPLAQPQLDQGAVPDATPLKHIQMMLSRSDDQQRELSQLMADQMTKGSPNFHAWLTPQDFGARFGPADADIKVVTDWLASQGFSDITVSPGKILIDFTGTAGLVRNAFHTVIHQFLVNGELHQANVSDVQFPAALNPVVRGIASLNDFRFKSMRRVVGPVTTMPRPQVTGANNSFFAVGPADFKKIYNFPSGLDGAGGKIAIIGFTDINPADIDSYRSIFALSAKSLNIIVNGEDPGFNGEEGEADLDVETAGGIAQRAQIDYVISEGTLSSQDPLVLGAEYVIFNNSDDVMSLSFGTCEPVLNSPQVGEAGLIHDLWEEGASQGISIVVSAGDNASAGCDDFNTQSTAKQGLAVNGLASTPFNVAVGGTDFDDVGTQTTGFWSTTNGTGLESANGYIKEVPWNDSCAFTATSANLTTCTTPDNIIGGSGGVSILYTRPGFQTGINPPGIAANTNARFLPDISLFASDGFGRGLNAQTGNGGGDPTINSLSFYIECEADTGADCVPDSTGGFNFQPVGGTSASTPAFAGILAIVGQSEANAGRSRRLGNVNNVLYNLAQTPANVCNSSSTLVAGSPTCVFYDITKGNNSVPCVTDGTNPPDCSAASGGLLVVPGVTPEAPAYTAAAGFDLATGLGSLNVTNLAAKWPTATLAATTTTTTINGSTAAIHIGHATGVTLAAQVTSAAGTPSGDVSFNAPQGTNFGGIANATLTNGIATGPAGTRIPGGMYALKAHYGGDATFAQSDDPTGVQVTVDPESSGILPQVITFSGNTGTVGVTNFVFGSPYILRVDMLNAIGTAANCLTVTGGTQVGCAFDASGNVTLTDNGAQLNQGTFQINSEGSFEDKNIDLTVGAHTILATYPGDNSYNASTATLNVTVTQAATTIAVAGNPTTGVNTTTPVTLTATVSSASNSSTGLTGTVQFFNNTNPIGSPVAVTAVPATANAGDGATATLNFTFPAGSASVTATYSGDTNYSGSGPSTALTFTVAASATNPAPTVSTISPTSATVGDPPFTLTVNGTGFIASSTVSFGGTVKTPIAGSVSATQLMVAITTADIATAGIKAVTVTNGAPGGGTSTAVNFTVNPTPTPTVTTISPGTVVVGSPAFVLTVNGTGFTASSVVSINGTARATTFVSNTRLTAAILASDVATVGNDPVTVTNPGNLTSTAVNLVVVNPTPTITSFSQNSVLAGSAGFTLTINGSGFVTGASVGFGAPKTPATVISATTLTVPISAAEIATAAVVPVVVINSNTVPGDNVSNTVNFTVANPVPTTTTIAPTSATAGGAAFTLTVNGTNFVSTSVVNFNGAAKATTFVSATQLTAAITATDIATAGTKPVTVTDPAPGGGTSTPAVNFTVNGAGGGTFSVTIPSSAQMLPSGSTLMVPISVTSSGGFAGSVTVNCTNLAPGVSCNNGQAFAINVTAANTTGNPAVGQLPVALAATSTTLTAMALPESNDLRHSPARLGLVTAGIGSGFAALFFLLVPGRKRLRAALGLSLVCVLSLALGCGGGGGGGTVTPVATTTQITLTPPAKSTGNFAFAAMVSGGSTPTGSVQFKDGANMLGSAVSLSGGSAMFTENGLTPAGTHSISASYSGDSGHMTSSSGAINVTVTGNNTITINVPGASNGANQNLMITVQ